jgi:threonine dehydratase
MTYLPSLSDIQAARARISPHLPVTPVTKGITLSEDLGRTVYLKWDNKLRTGSFKERGALNFLLNMSSDALSKGVCAASAGNHALGLSFHAHRLGVPCHLFMPANAPIVKVESCRKLGAYVSLQQTLNDSFAAAKELSSKEGITYVPPFDHEWTVCGQGVAALELLEQLPDFDSIIVPIGGGGYAAGIAAAVKQIRPEVYVLGVCSEWAMHVRKHPESHAAPIIPATIADGIAVKTIGNVTGPILDKYVDSIVSVSEVAIANAIISLLEHEHVVVEGAGAAAFAGLLEHHLPDRYKAPVVFISGSNIDMNLLSRLIERNMAERDRLLKVSVSLPDRPGMLHTISGIIASRGANVLQVFHDRFYTEIPGYVDITVVMEVRDRAHGVEIVEELTRAGLPTKRV